MTPMPTENGKVSSSRSICGDSRSVGRALQHIDANRGLNHAKDRLDRQVPGGGDCYGEEATIHPQGDLSSSFWHIKSCLISLAIIVDQTLHHSKNSDDCTLSIFKEQTPSNSHYAFLVLCRSGGHCLLRQLGRGCSTDDQHSDQSGD